MSKCVSKYVYAFLTALLSDQDIPCRIIDSSVNVQYQGCFTDGDA